MGFSLVPGECASAFKGPGKGIDLPWKRKALLQRQLAVADHS